MLNYASTLNTSVVCTFMSSSRHSFYFVFVEVSMSFKIQKTMQDVFTIADFVSASCIFINP
jgi:hypothetical protein